MVWRSGRYQELGQIKLERSGRSGHHCGSDDGDRGKNYRNHRVILLQQGEVNLTSVPVIGIITIDEECYYFHMTGNLSNNFPEVPVE